MKDAWPTSEARRVVEREAAAWVVREERGLTSGEQDALSQWLAADPRHGEVLRERRWAWREFDRLAGLPATVAPAPNPDLLALVPKRCARTARFLHPAAWSALAAAAAVVLWLALRLPTPHPPPVAVRPPSTALAAPCERLTLDDGSLVELNRGARVAADFTAGLRRVRLERGEACFFVARDPRRPFVVEAAGVTARAVGTTFNVRVDTVAVEVVVTEGRVEVGQGAGALEAGERPVLSASQHTVVRLASPATRPQVATLSAPALAARLAWQPRLLDFSDTSLAEIAAALNRRNPVQLTVDSPRLRALRVNGSIRSDNVEGFVRLLESTFEIRAEWRSETEIALCPAR